MALNVTPIPPAQQKNWNALIVKGKKLVAAQDKNKFELVFLFGEIESVYGEGRVERFADEIGIGNSTGKRYRKFAEMGVDKAFVEKWGTLGFTLISEVLSHNGRVANPSTQFFLNYALEHKMTVRAMEAFMLDTAARNRNKETTENDIKVALRSKQELEGYSDVILYDLERLVEDHPEVENELLQTAILNTEDVYQLKIKAGILNDEDLKMEKVSQGFIIKMKNFLRWSKEHEEELNRNIIHGHQYSDDLRFLALQIASIYDPSSELQERAIVGDVSEVQVVPSPLTEAHKGPRELIQ